MSFEVFLGLRKAPHYEFYLSKWTSDSQPPWQPPTDSGLGDSGQALPCKPRMRGHSLCEVFSVFPGETEVTSRWWWSPRGRLPGTNGCQAEDGDYDSCLIRLVLQCGWRPYSWKLSLSLTLQPTSIPHSTICKCLLVKFSALTTRFHFLCL